MRRSVRQLALLGAVGGALWLSDARRRAEELGRSLDWVLQRDIRETVTHRLNPVVLGLGLAGGRRSVWGVLEHVGRETGRVYRTPVLPIRHDDQLYIPLTYGPDVPLVHNVRASGTCRLQVHELMFELDEPMVVGPGEPAIPAVARPLLTHRRYLRLHILDVAPGTFRHPHEVVEEHAVQPVEGLTIVHPAVPSPEDAISAW